MNDESNRNPLNGTPPRPQGPPRPGTAANDAADAIIGGDGDIDKALECYDAVSALEPEQQRTVIEAVSPPDGGRVVVLTLGDNGRAIASGYPTGACWAADKLDRRHGLAIDLRSRLHWDDVPAVARLPVGVPLAAPDGLDPDVWVLAFLWGALDRLGNPSM